MLVKHIKHGILRVTGHQKGGLTLSNIENAKQVALSAKLDTYKILTRLNFRYKQIVSEQPKVEQGELAPQLTLDI